MSWKVLAFLLFMIFVAILIFVSYHNSLESKLEIEVSDLDNNQDDLLEMTPGEAYRITIHNALPEIKALSFLLLIVFIVAILGARFEIASDFTRDILNKSFESMVSRRGEKLAALEEKRRIQESLRVSDKSALDNVIAELERSIKEKNARNP